MKKIREILFTIVMIASCGCLLNVNIFASPPQNDNPTDTKLVLTKEMRQLIHEEMQAEGKKIRAKEYDKFYEKFKNEILPNPSADPYEILNSFCSNSPYPDEVKEIRIKCQDAISEKQHQNLCASIYEPGRNKFVLPRPDKIKLSPEIITSNEFEKNISLEDITNTISEDRRFKPFKKWLAEKEKIEQEGCYFALPLILNEEEEEQVENDCIIIITTNEFSPETNTSSMENGRRIKPFKKWLAEYEENNRKGYFALPSIFDDEEEEEEQEDVRSSSSFDSLLYLNDEEEEQGENEGPVLSFLKKDKSNRIITINEFSSETNTSSMEDGRRIKPLEKWLAEKEKNEQEGNSELPSIFDDEEDIWSSSSFDSLPYLNEEEEEEEDVRSSSSFDSLPYLNEEEEEEEDVRSSSSFDSLPYLNEEEEEEEDVRSSSSFDSLPEDADNSF